MYRPGGQLDADDLIDIYGPDPPREALTKAGFLEPNLTVHGWVERNVYAAEAEARIAMGKRGGIASGEARRMKSEQLREPVSEPVRERVTPTGGEHPVRTPARSSRSSRSSRPPQRAEEERCSSAESAREDVGPARSAGAARHPVPRSEEAHEIGVAGLPALTPDEQRIRDRILRVARAQPEAPDDLPEDLPQDLP